ncbi:MAG: ABC transporter ATP-binding protein, partial [Verrucomicrobiota bacterium]
MSAPTPKSEISNWAILSRLLRMTSAYRGRVGVILVLQVALLVSELVGLTFVGAGIDFLKFNFTDASGSPKWPLGWAPPEAWGAWSIIVFAAVAAVVAALLRGVLAWWAQRESSLLIHRDVVPDIQRRVFNKLQELHFRYFDTQTSGGIINRATGDIAAIRMFVETVLIETIILVITVTIYIVFMMQISPFLTLVCLATLPLMIAAALIFSKVIRPQYLERKRAFDRMILLLSESVQGIHTILGFAREPEMQQRFRERNEYVVEQQRGIFLCFSIFQPVVHLFTHFNLVILLLVGGKMVIDGQLAVGAELFVYAVLLQQFQNQVGTITNVANTVQDSFSAAERVFEVLDTPPEVETPQHPVTLERIHGAVTFENVSFQFSAKKSTLREISLSAEPGSTTALVGETGSGKSAL